MLRNAMSMFCCVHPYTSDVIVHVYGHFLAVASGLIGAHVAQRLIPDDVALQRRVRAKTGRLQCHENNTLQLEATVDNVFSHKQKPQKSNMTKAVNNTFTNKETFLETKFRSFVSLTSS